MASNWIILIQGLNPLIRVSSFLTQRWLRVADFLWHTFVLWHILLSYNLGGYFTQTKVVLSSALKFCSFVAKNVKLFFAEIPLSVDSRALNPCWLCKGRSICRYLPPSQRWSASLPQFLGSGILGCSLRLLVWRFLGFQKRFRATLVGLVFRSWLLWRADPDEWKLRCPEPGWKKFPGASIRNILAVLRL